MGATKTVWWDKNNDQHEGWIKDGKTYMDEAATTRVPIGATVQTNAGTYKMTSDGGIPTYATAKNQYEAKGNAAINAYKAAGNVQKERIDSATNAAIAELNRQKELIQTNRADADKAAREAYMKAANPFGAMEEQRVKLGLDESGYAESSKLKLASAYGQQLNENLRAMNEQLRNIDVQISQARASGQYELANMLEARAQNIMQQEIALQGNIFSGDMQALGQAESTRQFDEQMAVQKEQLAAQKEQAEADRKWELAMAFINEGKSASFIEEVLGIPQEDINTYIAAVNARKNASSGGGGSGIYKVAENENTKYLKTLLPVIEASGLTAAEWIEEYGAGYGVTSGSDKKELIVLAGDINSKIENTPSQSDRRANAAKSPYGTQYNNAKYVVAKMRNEGRSQTEIEAYLDTLSESELTDAGVAMILGLK
ncbi:MAG: hypothetical protein IJF32_05805 [Oscillospiraceae bacterium]|nr:hypothetical protein [Oscillospiraceae bacterium]